MKKLLFTIFILTATISLNAQKFFTKNATITFQSKGPLETIEGTNKTTTAVIDSKAGAIAFSVIVKGFVMEKQLMQKHFNENYMESDRYPKATFTGAYTGEVIPGKEGIYNVVVKGKLTIHGVTRDIETPATLQIASGKLLGRCVMTIKPEDYNIKIPTVVRDKIAKEVSLNIQIDCTNPK